MGYRRANPEAKRHMQERRILSGKVHGLDDFIINRLFRLSPSELERFFSLFEAEYGVENATYVTEAWIPWKTKKRGISGLNAGRFIQLAPKIFSWDDRYEIISKVYQRTLRHYETRRLTVTLGIQEEAFKEIENIFERFCQKPHEHEWPSSLTQFATWICDEDSVAAKKLITAIESEHRIMIAQAARSEINKLRNLVANFNSNVSATHQVKLPHGKITILIRKPTLWENIKKFFASF